jgi:hypothetical protein
MRKNKQPESIAIPNVDLAAYRFSPPGAMGWSVADYEKMFIGSDLKISESVHFSPPGIPKTPLSERPISRLNDSGDRADTQVGARATDGRTNDHSDSGKSEEGGDHEENITVRAADSTDDGTLEKGDRRAAFHVPEDAAPVENVDGKKERSGDEADPAGQSAADGGWILSTDPPPEPWLNPVKSL